jgi:hypothetical protein
MQACQTSLEAVTCILASVKLQSEANPEKTALLKDLLNQQDAVSAS